jgi:hypothetical protein
MAKESGFPSEVWSTLSVKSFWFFPSSSSAWTFGQSFSFTTRPTLTPSSFSSSTSTLEMARRTSGAMSLSALNVPSSLNAWRMSDSPISFSGRSTFSAVSSSLSATFARSRSISARTLATLNSRDAWLSAVFGL